MQLLGLGAARLALNHTATQTNFTRVKLSYSTILRIGVRRTDIQTDGRTHPLIKMLNAQSHLKAVYATRQQ